MVTSSRLRRALQVEHDLAGQPVVVVIQQELVIRQHAGRVAQGAQHPGAQLELVGAQVQDQVVQFAGHGQGPEPGALLVQPVQAARGPGVRSGHGDLGHPPRAVQPGRHVVVGDHPHEVGPAGGWSPRGGDSGGPGGSASRGGPPGQHPMAVLPCQRGQLDARPRQCRWAARPPPGQFPCPLADHLVPLGPGDGLVDQPPGHGLLAGQALGLGGEVVRAVAAHVPLVHHPGQPAGAGQHPEQGKFRQRHRGRAVIDEHDVFARKRQLVASLARGGPVPARPGRSARPSSRWRPRYRCGFR